VTSDLRVSDLHVAYGSHEVLNGLSLEVASGTFGAILGPSGCGKTTLLRAISGFERPSRGTIDIGGTVVDDGRRHVPPERRAIGYVPQEGGLFPHLTVGQNVGFGVRGRRRRRATVAELLDRVGLAAVAAKYPHQLSGGQQQRVALARALAVQPRLVLLDEPFAALDDTLRVALREEVKAILRDADATAVLVTHDQDEALSLADTVAVVRDGVVAQQATPQVLYASPLDEDLATLVGDANLLDGEVVGRRVTTCLGVHDVAPGAAAPEGLVTVLVRPEQVVDAGEGDEQVVRAVIESTSFHGHDALVRVAPESPTGAPTLVARMPGRSARTVGEVVTMRVVGPVWVWARRTKERPAAPDAGAQVRGQR
jgi:iron(III) transport system ATP-binding protein